MHRIRTVDSSPVSPEDMGRWVMRRRQVVLPHVSPGELDLVVTPATFQCERGARAEATLLRAAIGGNKDRIIEEQARSGELARRFEDALGPKIDDPDGQVKPRF